MGIACRPTVSQASLEIISYTPNTLFVLLFLYAVFIFSEFFCLLYFFLKCSIIFSFFILFSPVCFIFVFSFFTQYFFLFLFTFICFFVYQFDLFLFGTDTLCFVSLQTLLLIQTK